MSTQPNLASDRQVDPIISAVARGYGATYAPVANRLFPIVPVAARAGKIIQFGPEDFYLLDTRRAPGQSTGRVQYGYDGGSFALVDHSLEGGVPRERYQDAKAVPGIDLAEMAVRRVQRTLDIERESISGKLARDDTKYGASNKSVVATADKWDDPGADVLGQVADGRSAVRVQVGAKPDLMILPDPVFTKVRRNPNVLASLSNNNMKLATLEQLQELFEMEILVAQSMYYDPATKKFVDIWGTDVVMACTTPKSMQDMGSPAYGYTYQLDGFPEVEEPYYDSNTKTWYYPVSDAYQPVLTGVSSGYLFKGAIN